MTYKGRVEHGVVVLEGANRPPEGTIVRVEEEPTTDATVGAGLAKLAGQAKGLPATHGHEEFVRPTDAQLAAWMQELQDLAVSAPHADDSREAIYTRMPGE